MRIPRATAEQIRDSRRAAGYGQKMTWAASWQPAGGATIAPLRAAVRAYIGQLGRRVASA